MNFQNNRRPGSGFTNIQRVIGANAQNRLGTAIQGGVQSAASGVRQGLGQAQESFKTDLEKNKLDTDANKQVRENIIGQAKNLGEGQSLGDDQLSQFDKLRSGEYKGPLGLQNTDQLKGKAQEVSALSHGTETAGGRQALLQRFAAGARPYTAGQQRLDNLVLGQTGSNQLRQVRRAGQGLETGINKAASGAEQQGLTEQGRAQQFGQETKNLIGQGAAEGQTGQGALGEYQAQLRQQRDAARADQAKLLSGVQTLGTGKIDAEAAARLGIDPNTNIYDLSPEEVQKYINAGSQGDMITEESVANKADLARINALNRLGGYGQTQGLNLDQNRIGDLQKVGYDVGGLKQAAKEREEALNKQFADTRLSGDETYDAGLQASGKLLAKQLQQMSGSNPYVQKDLDFVNQAIASGNYKSLVDKGLLRANDPRIGRGGTSGASYGTAGGILDSGESALQNLLSSNYSSDAYGGFNPTATFSSLSDAEKKDISNQALAKLRESALGLKNQLKFNRTLASENS